MKKGITLDTWKDGELLELRQRINARIVKRIQGRPE